MSSQSPAAVLFDSSGNQLAVYNNAVPVNGTGTPALLFAGYDGYNAVTRYALMGALGNLGVSQASNNVSVLSNSTVVTSASAIFSLQYFGTQQVNIVVNVTSAPTGTLPTLQFTIQEVDPGNNTTVFGNSASTSVISTTGVFTASLVTSHSSAVKVSWTVTGTTPSFAGVYATITTKTTPDTQAISGTITASNPSVGTDGGASLTSDTQVGGIVSTSAPTYTAGNLNAFSLTTKGQLRIDGVYPGATATASAPDMGISAGYVTTLAPSYTNNTVNALSLDGYGNLRTVSITNKASTSNVTSVAASAVNTVILSPNQNRIFASIFNNSNKTMFVKLGLTASASSFSIQLFAGSYWEVPQDYQGEIDAVWASGATASALITELTP